MMNGDMVENLLMKMVFDVDDAEDSWQSLPI